MWWVMVSVLGESMWSAPSDWYGNYFGEEYLDDYSDYFTREREMEEVNQILSILSLEPGSSILDLCCGQGRHCIELAKRGYSVVGIDLSGYLLNLAEERAYREEVEARFLRCDMREIPFTDEFDAVINIFTSFGFLEDESEDQKVVQAVSRALKSGGLFLMDVVNRDWLLNNYTAKSWRREDGEVLLLTERRFDPLTSRNLVHIERLLPGGGKEEKYESVRLYSAHELVSMLGKEGLETVSIYGGLDKEKFRKDSFRIVVHARKR